MKTLWLVGALAAAAFGAWAVAQEEDSSQVEVWSGNFRWVPDSGLVSPEVGVFSEERAFALEGTLESFAFGEVIIRRPGLPRAVLSVRDATGIYIDGRKSESRLLEAGSEVRAKFQLDGSRVVAVRLDARTSDLTGVGGSGLEEDTEGDREMLDNGPSTRPMEPTPDGPRSTY